MGTNSSHNFFTVLAATMFGLAVAVSTGAVCQTILKYPSKVGAAQVEATKQVMELQQNHFLQQLTPRGKRKS